MRTSDKIFVAGHRGLVGSAIKQNLEAKGYKNLVVKTRDELDLSKTEAVKAFFAKEKPDVVFLAAAKVGGIHANDVYRADFLFENLQIQNNVIWSAHQQNVKELIFLGSSCIYPRECPQPMKEEYLLSSKLEFTNRPYALAKISGLELINAINMQYKRRYYSVMPTNLYGPGDNFHPENSHVLPALLRRFHEAKVAKQPSVVIWGTGTPRREFMYSLDCADAIVHFAEKADESFFESVNKTADKYFHINVGTGQEVTIAELAKLVKDTVGYNGDIQFDRSKPDGTPRKLLDSSRLYKLGWKPKTSLEAGLKLSYEWYRKLA